MTPTDFLKEIVSGKQTCMVVKNVDGFEQDILPRIKEEIANLLALGYTVDELSMVCDNQLYMEVIPSSMCKGLK